MQNEGNQPLLDGKAMTWAQVIVVAITIALNALDGFDVLSISFASPGIAKQWGIERTALGFVLSMELIGMAIGSVALGRAGDRFGRRPTALFSLALMTIGMFMVSNASGLTDLCIWRVMTGLVSEVSSARHRSLCVSLMVIGYPIGAVLGGMVTANLLKSHDWRAIFDFGAICTAIMIPLVWLLVPETPGFIIAKRASGALEKLNRTLAKLGHQPVAELPPAPAQTIGQSFMALFAPGLARNTILLTIAYFTQIISFYFILKWTPKIVVDMGFDPSSAGGVLVWANVGGALGGATFGLATRFISLKLTSLLALVASACMIVVFGQSSADLHTLAMLAGIGGFCTNAAMVGLYNLAAVTFPTELRSSGTGFTIGVGRGGAVLGPPLAGALFESGYSLPMVAGVMALGSVAALLAVAGLKVSAPYSTE